MINVVGFRKAPKQEEVRLRLEVRLARNDRLNGLTLAVEVVVVVVVAVGGRQAAPQSRELGLRCVYLLITYSRLMQ